MIVVVGGVVYDHLRQPDSPRNSTRVFFPSDGYPSSYQPRPTGLNREVKHLIGEVRKNFGHNSNMQP